MVQTRPTHPIDTSPAHTTTRPLAPPRDHLTHPLRGSRNDTRAHIEKASASDHLHPPPRPRPPPRAVLNEISYFRFRFQQHHHMRHRRAQEASQSFGPAPSRRRPATSKDAGLNEQTRRCSPAHAPRFMISLARVARVCFSRGRWLVGGAAMRGRW